MMPAAMNSDALKVAWLMMWKIAATAARRESGRTTVISPVADGRIGQQSLEIVLEQRHDGTQQQRGQARHADRRTTTPIRRGRIQTGKEEDPGLDHGRRMQERRYRRRRSHGLRQPEMERKLSGLGEHAQQYQDQRQRVQRIGTDQIARCQHGRQLEASDDVADQQDAGE